LKTSHHVQGEDEHVLPSHPQVPYLLRVQVERESRRMAGYLYGRHIADTFLTMLEENPNQLKEMFRLIWINRLTLAFRRLWLVW